MRMRIYASHMRVTSNNLDPPPTLLALACASRVACRPFVDCQPKQAGGSLPQSIPVSRPPSISHASPRRLHPSSPHPSPPPSVASIRRLRTPVRRHSAATPLRQRYLHVMPAQAQSRLLAEGDVNSSPRREPSCWAAGRLGVLGGSVERGGSSSSYMSPSRSSSASYRREPNPPLRSAGRARKAEPSSSS